MVLGTLGVLLLLISGSSDMGKNTCLASSGDDWCCNHYDPGNPYTCCSNTGNCAWWASYMRPDLPNEVWGYQGWPYYNGRCQWCDEARTDGFDVDSNPAPGDIAVIPPSCAYAGSNGHVVYVKSVDGSTIHISGMDWCLHCKYDKIYDLSRPGCTGTQFIHHKASDRVKIVAGRTGRYINHEWISVPYSHAVEGDTGANKFFIFANICSENGGDPSHVDIRNAYTDYFEVRVEEDDQYDGSHTTEDICYVVIAYNASYLTKRGYTAITQESRDQWTFTSYGTTYSSYRPMAANISTEHGGDNCHIDIRAGRSGFDARVEEDLSGDGGHKNERVDWVVWKTNIAPGMQSWYVNGVTEAWTQVAFPNAFTKTPVVIARITTENGGDCAIADIKDITKTGFKVRVEECRPCGDCKHTSGERIDWMAVEPGLLEW